MSVTRYVIEIDDEDRGPEDTGRPWTATLLKVHEDGTKSGDPLGAGLGATPQAALLDLARGGDVDWPRA